MRVHDSDDAWRLGFKYRELPFDELRLCLEETKMWYRFCKRYECVYDPTILDELVESNIAYKDSNRAPTPFPSTPVTDSDYVSDHDSCDSDTSGLCAPNNE
jgi:hypothetical protein